MVGVFHYMGMLFSYNGFEDTVLVISALVVFPFVILASWWGGAGLCSGWPVVALEGVTGWAAATQDFAIAPPSAATHPDLTTA